MDLSSRDSDWEKEKAELYEAFKGWHHTSCQQKKMGIEASNTLMPSKA
jgi:hypothetical protein